MSIGKIAGRAAGMAVDTVGDLMSGTGYPESEYGLAAFLFDRIAQVEKQDVQRDRAYYHQLMQECLATVRNGQAPAGGSTES